MQTLTLTKTLSKEQVQARAVSILAATRRNTMAFQHNLLVRHPLKLSNLEARIFVLALRCISQADTEFNGGFVVTLDELFPAGSSGERYEALEEAFKALLAKNFKLAETGGGEGSYIYTQLVSHIGLETGAGRVVGAFAPLIAPYLSQLKAGGNFTTAKIETLLTFKNATAQKLYWFLRSWSDRGKVEIGVDELKSLLFEKGDNYETYADFKRYVLKPCLAEVHKFGAWDVTVKELKLGRKVTSLLFSIPKVDEGSKKVSQATSAASVAPMSITLTEQQQKVVARLEKLQLKSNQIQDVLTFIGADDMLFARLMKATYKTLTDYQQSNFGHAPQDKLAAATVNIIKAEFGLWK